MQSIMLINVQMPTNDDILTFINMIYTTSENVKAGKELFFSILVLMSRWSFQLS